MKTYKNNLKNNLKTISITNLKGGVGKTTFCFHFGYLFAQKNLKTLLIDLDPQGNLTTCFLNSPPSEENHIKLLFEKRIPVPYKIKENLYLLSSDIELSKYELQVKLESYFRLKNFIELPEIKENYDVALIDTPPSLNVFTSNALIASSTVLCVIDQGEFALSGFKEIKSLIENINEGMKLNIKLLGPVFNMVKKRTLNFKKNFEKVFSLYKDTAFKSFVRYSVVVRDSIEAKKTVFELFPNHEISKDFLNVFLEFCEKAEIDLITSQ
ncbi:MAG: ParA family protein [Caldisericum sp.]